MRVTSKGQVTIPKPVRDHLGIGHNTEVEFRREGERWFLVNATAPTAAVDVQRFVGILNAGLSTDELMRLTRGDD